MNKDAKYVVAALIMAAGLALPSLTGFTWVIYVAFTYLALNAVFMVVAAGVLHNPDIFPRKESVTPFYRNHALQALVNIITAMFLYKVYIDGFVFLAGLFTFMLTISAVSNTFTALASKKE